MKFAPPRLHSDNRAKVRLVTKQLCNQLIWNWLSLSSKSNDGERGMCKMGIGLMKWYEEVKLDRGEKREQATEI